MGGLALVVLDYTWMSSRFVSFYELDDKKLSKPWVLGMGLMRISKDLS